MAGSARSANIEAETETDDISDAERSPAGVTVALFIAAIGLSFAGAWTVQATDSTESGLWSVLPVESFVAVLVAAVAFGLVISKRPVNTQLAMGATATLFLTVEVLPTLAVARIGTPISWLRAGLIDVVAQSGATGAEPMAKGLWSGSVAFLGFIQRTTGLESTRMLVMWLPALCHLALIVPTVLWARRLTTGAARFIAVGFVVVFGGIGMDVLSGDAIAAVMGACLLAVIGHRNDGDRFDQNGQATDRTVSHSARSTVAERIRQSVRGRDVSSFDRPTFSERAGEWWSTFRTDALSHYIAVSLVAMLFISLPIATICTVAIGVLAAKHLLPVPSRWVVAAAALWGAAAWVARLLLQPGAASPTESTDDRLGNIIRTIQASVNDRGPGWTDAGGAQRLWLIVGLVAVIAVAIAIIANWRVSTPTEQIVVATTFVGGLLLSGNAPLLTKVMMLSAPTAAVMIARRFDDRAADQDTVDRQSLGITLIVVAAVLSMFGVRHADLSYTALRPSDIAALGWVAQSTPDDAVVLSTGTHVPWDISAQGGRAIVAIQDRSGDDLADSLDKTALSFRSTTPIYVLLPVSEERLRMATDEERPLANSQIARSLTLSNEWDIVFQIGGSYVLSRR